MERNATAKPELPNESGSPEGESPLTTAASIISILTFVYAVIVGLLLYSSAIRNSKKDIRQLIESLEGSFSQMVNLTQSLPGVRYHQHLEDDVQSILQRMQSQLKTLRQLRGEYEGVSGWLSLRRLNSRVRFPFIREKLQKKVTEKDQLMDELHRCLDKHEKAKEKWEYEAHQTKQDAILDQQRQLLEALLHRVEGLDASQRELKAALVSVSKNQGMTQMARTEDASP